MRPVIGIILGSTREGRVGERVGRWVFELASKRDDLSFEFIDLRDWPLPFYPHAAVPKVAERSYTDGQQRAWVELIERLDGFILVTPEYNHGYSAILKNALDFTYTGWNKKPVAFVSYGGSAGGVRVVQQLRQVAVELQLVALRNEVNIPFVAHALDDQGKPRDEFHAKQARGMLDQLSWWARALKTARTTVA